VQRLDLIFDGGPGSQILVVSSIDTSVLIMHVMNFMIMSGLGLPLDMSCVHTHTHTHWCVGGGQGGGGGGWGGEGGGSGVTLAPPTSMSL
jgi:hypothetical protein